MSVSTHLLPEDSWLTASKDSDILSVKVFGMNLIIVNSLEAATDLLDKRSSIYSDRYSSSAS